jgi:hypothetical protein
MTEKIKKRYIYAALRLCSSRKCRSLKPTKFQLLGPETVTHITFERGYVSTFESKWPINNTGYLLVLNSSVAIIKNPTFVRDKSRKGLSKLYFFT